MQLPPERDGGCGPGRGLLVCFGVELTAPHWLWNRRDGGEPGTTPGFFPYLEGLHIDNKVKWRWEIKDRPVGKKQTPCVFETMLKVLS